MENLTAEQIVEKLERFYELITIYLPDNNRTDKLIQFYKDRELTLGTSPASSKLSYHNCFAGGYLDHVIRVTEAALILDKVWDRFDQKRNHTTEELVFVAINHDLGKLGTDDQPLYIPNTSEWHVRNQGKIYNHNPILTNMDIPDRSIYYLQQAGIEMSENEYIGIKIHDGMYSEANKYYLMPSVPERQLRSNLPYIIHQADLLASKVETQI
jgi:hypothetical protein